MLAVPFAGCFQPIDDYWADVIETRLEPDQPLKRPFWNGTIPSLGPGLRLKYQYIGDVDYARNVKVSYGEPRNVNGFGPFFTTVVPVDQDLDERTRHFLLPGGTMFRVSFVEDAGAVVHGVDGATPGFGVGLADQVLRVSDSAVQRPATEDFRAVTYDVVPGAWNGTFWLDPDRNELGHFTTHDPFTTPYGQFLFMNGSVVPVHAKIFLKGGAGTDETSAVTLVDAQASEGAYAFDSNHTPGPSVARVEWSGPMPAAMETGWPGMLRTPAEYFAYARANDPDVDEFLANRPGAVLCELSWFEPFKHESSTADVVERHARSESLRFTLCDVASQTWIDVAVHYEDDGWRVLEEPLPSPNGPRFTVHSTVEGPDDRFPWDGLADLEPYDPIALMESWATWLGPAGANITGVLLVAVRDGLTLHVNFDSYDPDPNDSLFTYAAVSHDLGSGDLRYIRAPAALVAESFGLEA
jgi:hypothetical protein